ncbi:MAG: bL28 family ribosomal protein [Oscillospiraceae bacterium]|jgi:large subunit ribosomal protein L28|nr:bL28 family ribosomal protein [Oscillospiraceae bacterium]
MSKCEVCGKTNNSARKYSYRGTQVTKKVLRVQKPNVKKFKVIENGAIKRVYVCSRCLRSERVVRAI